jgi:hypothetical protein
MAGRHPFALAVGIDELPDGGRGHALVGAELAGEGRARADMLPAHGTLRKANGHDDRSIAAGEARQRHKAARESRRRQKQTMEQAHGKAPVGAVTAASLARRRREFNAMRAA